MHKLRAWFATRAGQELAERESRLLSRRLAGLYARRVLQVGAYGGGRCPTVYGDARQWVLDDWPGGPIDLQAQSEVLPLASSSVDVVVLIHQLEFTDRPHQVIREAARVLAPEGHMLVMGFNPLSLWGLRRLMAPKGAQPPWSGRYLGPWRVADWMQLLGLTPRPHEGLALLPPVPDRLRRRQAPSRVVYGQSLGAGLRWLAGVNLVMGQKRVGGVAPPAARWHQRLELIPGGLTEAGARHARRDQWHDAG